MSAYSEGRGGGVRRLATETKEAFKTTEFWIFVLVAIGLLIAGNSVEAEEGGADVFAADKVWLYITILAAAYFIGRGLAKSGSRDQYWDNPNRSSDGGIAERVEAAVGALKGEPQPGNGGGQPQYEQGGQHTQGGPYAQGGQYAGGQPTQPLG